MALVPSTMRLSLGDSAPDFTLPDPDGKTFSLSDFQNAKALLVMFACNHCPYVKHVKDGMAALARDYAGRGAAIVAINSNDVENYPDDSPPKMKIFAADSKWTFPYLYDETQGVAKAYKAACTPDFFLFDANQRLAYRGQMDSSRPGGSDGVTGKDLRAALDAVLGGKPAPAEQKPSIGCNIKWKKGREPEYFKS